MAAPFDKSLKESPMFESTDNRRGERAILSGVQGPGTSPSRPESSGSVDLPTLINCSTPLAWFEAVAIVQELCVMLLATRLGGRGGDLEPEDVAITSAGGVEVRGGVGQGLPPVARIGHLLLVLLEEAESQPVQLRLLALQEVSGAPAGTTLREWSGRLAAFERPGRQRIIREVYERFTRLPASDTDAVAQPAARTRAAAARRRWWKNPRLQNAAVSAAVLVGAGLAAVWLWSVVIPILSGDRDQTDSGVGAASATGSSMSAEETERIRAAAFRIWGGAGARPVQPASDAPIAANPIVVVVPSELPLVTSAEVAELPGLPNLPAGSRSTTADLTVYSAADAAVAPPALVRPRLPTRPGSGAVEANLPQVELVVSASGEVEAVKLVTEPADVKSAMMLSAIKTWRFAPATRDGIPVSYRLRLRLTNQ